MPVLAGGVMILGALRASGAAPTLTWEAPPECPDAADVDAQVREAIGDARNAEALEHVHARVRATDDDRWELVVTFASQGARRRLVLDSCAAAGRATAFIVAIAVDPRLGGFRTPAGPQAEAAAMPPAAPTPTQTPAPSPPRSTSSPGSAIAPRRRPPSAVAPRTSRRVRGFLQLGAAVQAGTFPTATPGVLAGAGVGWSRARLSLGYARWFGSHAVLDARPDAGGEVSVHAFTASAGPLWRRRTLELPLRGGVELGALRAAGFGTDSDRTHRRLWLALTLGSGLHWVPRALGGHGALVIQADVTVAALRPTLVIADSLEVFEIGPIAFRGAVLLEARFP